MKSVTIGQYIPGNSLLHKLDPRFKILLVFISNFLIFLLSSLSSSIICLSLILLVYVCCGLPIFKIIRGLRQIIYLSLFIFLFNVLTTSSGTLLHRFDMYFSYSHILILFSITTLYFLFKKNIRLKLSWFLIYIILIFYSLTKYYFDIPFLYFSFDIYKEIIIDNSIVITRLMLFICVTYILTLTTNTMAINNALESLLCFLLIFRVPRTFISLISFMFSLVLRFIPLLLIESDKIFKAQASRGVDFKERSFFKKIKQLISLIIPLFSLCITKAELMADAMTSRGYIPGMKRTKLDLLKYTYYDLIGLFIFILIIGILLIHAYVI